MPAFEPIPAMPVWVELSALDPRQAKKFYRTIFNWTVHEAESGYLTFSKDSLPVAGVAPRTEDAPHPDMWLLYLMSEDLAADTEAAATAGAHIVRAPSTQEQAGHSSMLVDPTGALVGLWQPLDDDQFIAAGEHGTPVWFELVSPRNFQAAKDFYATALGWQLHRVQEDYYTAQIEEADFLGLMNVEGQVPDQAPAYWAVHFGVADLTLACSQVVELGGEIAQAPTETPFGTSAVVLDPGGALLILTEVTPPPILSEAAFGDFSQQI